MTLLVPAVFCPPLSLSLSLTCPITSAQINVELSSHWTLFPIAIVSLNKICPHHCNQCTALLIFGTNNIEHLFMCLSAPYLLWSACSYLSHVLLPYYWDRRSFTYSEYKSCFICTYQFLPVCGMAFISFMVSLEEQMFYILMTFNLYIFLLGFYISQGSPEK